MFLSCKSPEPVSQENYEELKIVNAFKTPLLGGAPGTKGTKISLCIAHNEGISLDSLRYLNKVKPLNLLKHSSDTSWVEGYFYEGFPPVIGQSASEIRNSDSPCFLYYTLLQESKKISIPHLILAKDSVLWK